MKSTYIPIPKYTDAFDAVRYTGSNKSEILELLGKDGSKVGTLENGDLMIKTSEQGFQPLTTGQYVLRYPNEQIAIGPPTIGEMFMPAPVAVEAEFEKQKKVEADKHERDRIVRSGDVLFR